MKSGSDAGLPPYNNNKNGTAACVTIIRLIG